MILIIASNLDDQAKQLKAKWENDSIALLSVNDLTSPGWEISSDNFLRSRFIAEGNVWSVKEITGIINILPVISPYELFKIVAEDRQYVASELNAFLFYFLTKFKCPILNKPSAFNLSGPFIKQAEWLKECVKVSLPVYSYHAKSDSKFHSSLQKEKLQSVSFIDNYIYGNDKINFKKKIKALAANTGLNCFNIHFKEKDSRFYFYAITTYPDFNNPKTVALIQNYFTK